jgi:tetratricopeptide (TPR) repeat protein
MRRIRRGAAPLFLCLALGLVAGENLLVAPRAAARRIATSVEQELAFYPSGRMLRQFTCGFQSLAADLLWLRAIQYYGEHRKTDLIFDKAAHVFRVLTDLDPGFVEAYRFGALVIVEDAGEPEVGFEILRKGMRENPGRWELPFDLGFHHLLRADYGRAAAYLRRASELRPGDERIRRFLAYAEGKRGGLEASEEMWRELRETTENESFRQAADFALLCIQAARDTTVLAGAARSYHERFASYPEDPADLVRAGLIERVPAEPFGERYLVHPITGEVRSSFLLTREIRYFEHVLQLRVNEFRMSHGRLPANVDELVVAGRIDSVPSPWGVSYELDAATGTVRAAAGSARGRVGS